MRFEDRYLCNAVATQLSFANSSPFRHDVAIVQGRALLARCTFRVSQPVGRERPTCRRCTGTAEPLPVALPVTRGARVEGRRASAWVRLSKRRAAARAGERRGGGQRRGRLWVTCTVTRGPHAAGASERPHCDKQTDNESAILAATTARVACERADAGLRRSRRRRCGARRGSTEGGPRKRPTPDAFLMNARQTVTFFHPLSLFSRRLTCLVVTCSRRSARHSRLRGLGKDQDPSFSPTSPG